MANSINIPRTHLIMGLCLPLAVLVGYFLAQPMESGSIAVVLLVICFLCVPLFMKWHHPLLILSWNAAANPLFLPGRPALWMVMAFISLFFALLSRSVNSHRRFIQVPSMTKPLIFFGAVVLVTAQMNGGIGIRSLGSDQYGGKAYFYVLGAIVGYFAFTSQRIPVSKLGLYVGMFFLAGLTAFVGDLALLGGSASSFLLYVFAPDYEMVQAESGALAPGMVRLGALPIAGAALYAWLLARRGFKGSFDLGKPWRLGIIVVAVIACLASGYRSSLILFALTLGFLFCFEGLHRTRLLPALAGIALLAGAVVFPQADKLPLMAQRALSFLPIVPVDPVAKESAQASTEWRVEMWKQILPQVPRYLIKGKGYALDPNDMFMAELSAHRGFGIQASGALVAGDYHNGPLSVLIPFGVFGLVGFVWVLTAGGRLLYYYHRFGNPELQRLNTFLLAAYFAKLVFFVLIFGSLRSDFFTFLGLIGLAVSFNGAPQTATEPEITPEPLTVFSERAY
jgi:hypothetical protein